MVRFRNKFGMTLCLSFNNIWWKHIYKSRNFYLEKSKNPGGLSGLPLFEKSTHVLRVLSEHLKGELPIIASGGVMSAELAVEKMKAGASLVQIYSGFIYRGPVLISEAAQAIKDWSESKK